jgi:RHS repeat-associated protein
VQSGRRVKFTYSAHGYLSSQELENSAIGPVFFDHDVRGRLLAISWNEGTCERFEYDAADLLIKRELGPAIEHLTYDSRRRVKSRKLATPSGREIVSRSFAYDPAFNLLSVDDSRRGAVSYQYSGDSLTRSNHAARGSVSYAYDETGNIIRRGPDYLRYESGDRLAEIDGTVLRRDANGNLISSTRDGRTTRYEWNQLDQLVSVTHSDGTTSAYAYDGLGRRVWKKHRGRKTSFYWAGDDLLCEESEGDSVDYCVTRSSPLIIWETGRIRHVVTALVAAPLELVDERGELVWEGDYDDWGLLLSEKSERGAANRLRLPGQYWDEETGFHYNRFRYYAPRAGQFVSPDPLGVLGGLNEFLYAPNPVNWADPLGLTCGNTDCGVYSVYVLKKNNKIVYIGITMQSEAERMAQHVRDGKSFDKMVIVAESLPKRRAARDIEGSALYHVGEGKITAGIDPSGLQNEVRLDGGYYHAYHSPPGGDRTLLGKTATSNILSKDLRTHTPV